jgi:endoglycosylceramidase
MTGTLKSIARTARMLGRHGIQVLVDFHQDLFNERFNGEGFSRLGRPGRRRFRRARRRLSGQLLRNARTAACVRPLLGERSRRRRRHGAVGRVRRRWNHAANRLRRQRAIFGYDVFNEAWPGTVPDVREHRRLPALRRDADAVLYARVRSDPRT